MKMLRRNLQAFEYRAYRGKQEIIDDDLHTGEYHHVYDAPIMYRGNVAPATSYEQNQLFGGLTDYSHIILFENPDTDIEEHGLIDWQGKTYEIKRIAKSLNVLSVAIKKIEAGAIL